MYRNHRAVGRIILVTTAMLALVAWTAFPATAETHKSSTAKTTTVSQASSTSKPATSAPKAEKAAAPAAAKAEFLIISPHTPEECMAALEQAETLGSLSKFEWGCKSGDHTAYAFVTAASAEDALKLVPANVRAQAKAVKVTKFTPAELKSMHASATKS